MQIKEILTLDIEQDIKNVIDLENFSENEIKEEIENYIVTEGLSKEYYDFISIFLSNITETGVWISGFYGSGKSYFGKIIGYLLSNKNILGTPARDRILQRFTGLADEALLKNIISKLGSINTRVIFMDLAKQDTTNGLAYTLFRNFLKSLDLPQNEHGYLLYKLMLDDNQIIVEDYVYEKAKKNWIDIKTQTLRYVKVIKKIYLEAGNTNDDYNNIIESIRREIDEFDASKLQAEIKNYLDVNKDEKIVFLFDEASEAINQGRFTLLDLEGVSEAMSALGNRVWTIAIAQEKLDDVINNSNVSRAQLTKVTDRFKTKIHLEATEVDQIIKSRLLKKTTEGIEKLKENFKNHSGQISDHSNLIGAGIEKTENEESYITYYPFYKYQFDLMQNFLFGTKGYVSTKVAARGMIITTFDILRKQVKEKELFKTVTGWQITEEAQPSPPVRLVNRYDNAERIVREKGLEISGRKLLETINFLAEAEVAKANIENIVKAFIDESASYQKIKEEIEQALSELVESKILIQSQGMYKITSDIEQRLLDEMTGYTVQGFMKKKRFVEALKNSDFIKKISRVIDGGLSYNFYITTDDEDELTTPSNKSLRMRIKSIYNLSDDRTREVESLKVQHQNDKDLIWLVPNNNDFHEIDKLIDEVERIGYLEQKYNDPNSEEGKILLGFSTEKNEKQKRIRVLIESALMNSEMIYLFNVYKLDENNSFTIVEQYQKELIGNVYTKRLTSQLSDNIAKTIINEADDSRLHRHFHGEEFRFFDSEGKFIGEKLKVTEEILFKIRNSFVDGKTLEAELEKPPTGFSFGTVISTLAVLMRAGKVIAKYNGEEKFSWRDKGVNNIFSNAREFRKASFKAVSKSLSLQQKQEIVQFMLDIETEKYIGRKIDYNTNDFELAAAVRDIAKHFVDKLTTLQNSEKEFNSLFPNAGRDKDFLENFTGSVSEANYIDKANEFLNAKEDFLNALERTLIIEKFIRNKLPNVKLWQSFAESVVDELQKATRQDDNIQKLTEDFERLYSENIVENYSELQGVVQKIKDSYHSLFSKAMSKCAEKYSELYKLAENILSEINSLPKGLNDTAKQKVENIKLYAEQRLRKEIDLEFDVKDKKSKFTYSEVLSFIDLYNSKKSDLEILRAGLIKVKPDEPQQSNMSQRRTFVSKLPSGKMKVSDYKEWLHGELQKIASANEDDEIEFE